MLNNRAILTVYNVLLWPCFALIAAIGYVSYRKNKWNLEGKLSYQWHYTLSANDRARIQANVSVAYPDMPKKPVYVFLIHAIVFILTNPPLLFSSIVVDTNHSLISTSAPTNASREPSCQVASSNTKHSVVNV